VLALLLVLLLAWPIGLLIWANGKIQHVDALSDAPGTPGRVFLLAGSDSRADGAVADGTEGQRTDTIMLLTAPRSGTPSLVSLPRDTYVEVPGHGRNKLNASYSLGGAPLLVETVEGLTGMKVDHYVEIGMGGVQALVDAVGGVELCLDYDVNDELSGLVWTAGCHVADGPTALAFARMRYSDPQGDIGRAQRQQQLISAVSREVGTPATVLNPVRQANLVSAGTGVLVTDRRTGIIDLGRLAMTFRAASGPTGFRGTPPIADPDYRVGGLGSTVLLGDDAGAFFGQVAEGTLEPPEATPEPTP
jgi:LCP family protein required for cell wall assembly